MRNTFRYIPTQDDYIKCYGAMSKTYYSMPAVVLCGIFGIMAVYYAFADRNLIYAASFIVCAAVLGFTFLYLIKFGIKKRTIKQISKSDEFFEAGEITITPRTIEIKNLPEEGKAQIIGIYPYNIMKVIYETPEQFIFVLGSVTRFLPKRIVPPQLQEEVFADIRKSNKCFNINRR